MQSEYFKEHSEHLDRDMEFKVFGHAGKPVLVFPSLCGRFYEFEDFGMVEAVRFFLDEGRIRLFCVDGIDGETWAASDRAPAERIQLHERYVRYVLHEVLPRIRALQPSAGMEGSPPGVLTTGCSMGAFHAASFFFRRPDVFDAVIALSGVYRTRRFLGDYMDPTVRACSVLDSLGAVTDERLLALYRRARIVVCTGQGAWEDEMRVDTAALRDLLERMRIPAWVDFWGHDVNHDWPWWRLQMPYFLQHVL